MKSVVYLLLHLQTHTDLLILCSGPQPSDADVVARPAEDGGGEQEGPDGHELHQVAQQSGRPADCVSVHQLTTSP